MKKASQAKNQAALQGAATRSRAVFQPRRNVNLLRLPPAPQKPTRTLWEREAGALSTSRSGTKPEQTAQTS